MPACAASESAPTAISSCSAISGMSLNEGVRSSSAALTIARRALPMCSSALSRSPLTERVVDNAGAHSPRVHLIRSAGVLRGEPLDVGLAVGAVQGQLMEPGSKRKLDLIARGPAF